MSGWPRVEIRKLAKLGTGHTPSRSVEKYWVDCTIPWLTLADVGPLRSGTVQIVSETKERISELGLANSAAVLHPAGTVALSRTASVGYSCILGVDMATSQDYVTWTCGPKLLNRYLLWVLRGERESIIGRMIGSTHKTIYMPDIEQLDVPLPPLATQQLIADYLDVETARIDALIAKKQRLVELLEERFMSRVDDECSGERVALRRVVARFVDYRGATPDKTEEGVPLLTATHIKNGVIEHSLDPVFVSEGTYESWMRRGFPARGDVVLTMEAPLGEVAQISEERVALAQRLMLLQVESNRCTGDYLAFALRSTEMQHRLKAHATGSTALGIKADRLKGLPVPIPSATRQDGIVTTLRREEREKTQVVRLLLHQIDLLVEHRQALITAAVTGEITVPGAA